MYVIYLQRTFVMAQTLLKAASLRVCIPALDLRGLDLPGARCRGVGTVKVERESR